MTFANFENMPVVPTPEPAPQILDTSMMNVGVPPELNQTFPQPEEDEQVKKEEDDKKKQGIKTVQCSGIKSNGQRCSLTTETKKESWNCQYHRSYKPNEETDNDGDGIMEVQCSATTGSGKRCKNRTENKNKRCYAHQ